MFGSVPEDPSYRAPIAARLMPELPSQPSRYSAPTSCRLPSGASSRARASRGPSSTDTARQPASSVTLGSSAAASRSTSSTSDCGACWPASARSSTRSGNSANALRKRVISCPNRPVQKTTSWAYDTGSGAAARSRSAMPQRRRCSMVRALVVLARGRSGSSAVRGSTTSTSTPRRPSSIAAARPLGPPPTISTGTRAGTSVIGSPVVGHRSTGERQYGEGAPGPHRPLSVRFQHPWPGSPYGPALPLTGRVTPEFSDRAVPLLPLPDPGPPVVVAVGRAQHGVDVEGLRGVVVEEDAAVVVEFGDQHRRLQPVVEDVAGSVPADPGEPGLVEVGLDLGQPGRAGALGQQPDEGRGDAAGGLLGGRRQVGDPDALDRDDPVVLEGAGQVPLVAGVHPALGHRRVDHLGVHDRCTS